MNESAYIFDVDESNFSGVVLENSHKLPVLVDFWAEWCQPCQTLIPILHKLAEELAGQFVLAKVDSDAQQALSQQLGVKGLPTVKLFVKGEVVDEFTGAQSETHIRSMLGPYMVRESDKMMAAAVAEYEQGNIDAAIGLMKQAAESDPANTSVQVMYIRVLSEHGHSDEANQVLANLPAEAQQDPDVISFKAQFEIMQQAGGADVETLQARIAADENDLEAREQLSAVLVSQGQFQPALQQLLEVMQRDRSYKDDAGRKGLIRLFEMLGSENPLVAEYRRRMATLLF